MRKIAALCAAVVVLASCVGVDSKMTIRDNGSGILVFSYRVSQLVADLGDSTSGKGVVPLPLSRADFERSLASAKGRVRLTRFDRSENEKDITIRAELAFDSLEALSQVEAFQDAELKTGTEGARHSFSQLIARVPAEPITEDTQRMLDAFFDGYQLTFAIETPQPIQSSTLGTVSSDRKSLKYTTTIKDIMQTRSDIVLTVTW
jgi:hypothetical protein